MKIILATVIAAFCVLQVSGHSTKERLVRDLTSNYYHTIEPDGGIDLKMSIMLLCSWVDKDTGFVISYGWESYNWRDNRLTWNPTEYGGINSLRLAPNYVWTPDMLQFNTMTSEVERDEKIYAVVMSDGSIIWIPRVTYRSVCSKNEDKIDCHLRIGSWTYDGNMVRLQVAEGTAPLDLSIYNSACPLEVESHTASVVNHTYPCCEETYPSMDVDLTLKPRQ